MLMSYDCLRSDKLIYEGFEMSTYLVLDLLFQHCLIQLVLDVLFFSIMKTILPVPVERNETQNTPPTLPFI